MFFLNYWDHVSHPYRNTGNKFGPFRHASQDSTTLGNAPLTNYISAIVFSILDWGTDASTCRTRTLR
jgi:hypothetical protein